MKAWQQDEPAGPLRMVELPAPALHSGGALLDVVSAQAPAHTDVFAVQKGDGPPEPGCSGPGG